MVKRRPTSPSIGPGTPKRVTFDTAPHTERVAPDVSRTPTAVNQGVNHSATDSKVRASTGAQYECRTGARADPGVTQAVAPAFVPAIKFTERRTGQCFKMGNLGLGFYQDGPQTDKTISDERTVTPEWPAIHSARWGEVDFPGRQPRCVDAERALFRRHNQIVAPESQVRGEPLLNYNSSVRVGSAPASGRGRGGSSENTNANPHSVDV